MVTIVVGHPSVPWDYGMDTLGVFMSDGLGSLGIGNCGKYTCISYD